MSKRVQLVDEFGRPLRRARPRVLARYDAAQTDAENRRHWSAADNLSARLANALDVRKKLRERARYEAANNSYCRGIVRTLAADVVGTGPRLQIGTELEEVNAEVERAFAAWALAARIPEKLATLQQAKRVDGEAFAVLTTNNALSSPVKVDLRPIECDQFTDPAPWRPEAGDPDYSDGIRYDRWGNPVSYIVLRDHPGDGYGFGEYDVIPARQVIHWFRCDRPGQVRGIPEITPALPLFAMLRRFGLATLTAAETAAMFAVMLQSQASGSDDDDQVTGDPFEELEIARGMMTTLPAGYTAAQLKAEHPTTNHEMFVWSVLREIARCLDMPLSKAAGDSSRNNYASGRLEFQSYFKAVDIEQTDCERVILARLFAAWLEEALLVPGYLPEDAAVLDLMPAWMWDGTEHVDPMKEAVAQRTRLGSLTTTLADEWARQGYDWRAKLQQAAIERKLMKELGLDIEPSAERVRTEPIEPEPTDAEDAPEKEEAR